ncbi:MAG: type II secretion system F family protein [Anaerovoracaceae bacterium]
MKEKFTNEEIRDFCLRLAMFLHGGIDFGEGLALLADEEKETGAGKVFQDMMNDADGGKPLSACVRASGSFPVYVSGMLEAGEKTGRLEEALEAVADYFSNRLVMERRLRTTLLHPAVLLLIMMAIVVILLTKVLPVFDQVYRQLGSQLSGAAGGLLLLGQILEKCMPLFCAAVAVAAVLLFFFSSGVKFRAAVEKTWKKHFGGRGVCGSVNRAAAAQVLSMAMESGFPVEEALILAENLLEDVPAVSQCCRVCAEELEKGTPLAQAVWQGGLLSRTDSRMLAAGIRSGSGEQAMHEIAERMQEDSEAALDELAGRVEPALVLTLSVLTGIILLTVMLPLVQLLPVLS